VGYTVTPLRGSSPMRPPVNPVVRESRADHHFMSEIVFLNYCSRRVAYSSLLLA